jgi:hypothetical protein
MGCTAPNVIPTSHQVRLTTTPAMFETECKDPGDVIDVDWGSTMGMEYRKGCCLVCEAASNTNGWYVNLVVTLRIFNYGRAYYIRIIDLREY